MHLRNHIIPVFGRYGLAGIRPTMVQQWVKELQSVKGLAPSTIETIYVIFASTMRGAVRDGYIRKTPCADIRLPEKTPTVVRLLTPAEVLALAGAMPDRYALLVLLGAGAGLRQGEAFGLALDRVDTANGMITVDQQVIIVDRHPVLALPRPRRRSATCPCPTSCGRPSPSMPAGSRSARPTCCAGPPGGPCCAATTTTARSGSPPSRRPGSRKTRPSMIFGTLSPVPRLAEGVPISEVSRWLGHKSITTTVDLYGHLVPEASARARDALDGAFAAARARGGRGVPRSGACAPDVHRPPKACSAAGQGNEGG